MNDMTQPEAMEDSAWAAVNTPLSVDELMTFCADVERLFRINPMLEFTNWERKSENRFAFAGKNISQEQAFEFDLEISVTPLDDGFLFEYDKGIKSSTTLKIESSPQGSRLTLTDRYERLPVEEREAHVQEVDKSLVIWAEYLQKYLINWRRWSKFGLWRWYMRRVWQPMKPSGRRITYMLLWISVVEIALIALGAGIYFAKYA